MFFSCYVNFRESGSVIVLQTTDINIEFYVFEKEKQFVKVLMDCENQKCKKY